MVQRALLRAQEHIDRQLLSGAMRLGCPLTPEARQLVIDCMAAWVVLQEAADLRTPAADVAQALEVAVGRMGPRGRLGVVKHQELQGTVARVKAQLGVAVSV